MLYEIVVEPSFFDGMESMNLIDVFIKIEGEPTLIPVYRKINNTIAFEFIQAACAIKYAEIKSKGIVK